MYHRGGLISLDLGKIYHLIGPNPNSQPSGNDTRLITGYHRGDTPGMAFVINFHNVFVWYRFAAGTCCL